MFGIWWLKYALIGAAILMVLIYIGVLKAEVSHYQTVAEENKQEYLVYKANAEAQHKVQQDAFGAMTLKYKQQLIETYKQENAKNQVIKERIAADEASKGINLPDSSVRVFNDSASNQRGESTPTESGNVSGTNSSEVPFTLNDLLSVSADNNSEHWKCIDQVHEWQGWYHDLAAGVAQAEAIARSP